MWSTPSSQDDKGRHQTDGTDADHSRHPKRGEQKYCVAQHTYLSFHDSHTFLGRNVWISWKGMKRMSMSQFYIIIMVQVGQSPISSSASAKHINFIFPRNFINISIENVSSKIFITIQLKSKSENTVLLNPNLVIKIPIRFCPLQHNYSWHSFCASYNEGLWGLHFIISQPCSWHCGPGWGFVKSDCGWV